MATLEKKLQVWKPLRVGQRVKIVCKYRKGERGTIKECLDDMISGLGRYGITLDSLPNCTADFQRHELALQKQVTSRN